MKIVIFDSNVGKFTNDMMRWWQAKGYEVQRETHYNPELVVWADVVWFDLADNNLISASNPDQALKDEWAYTNRPGAWDMHDMDLSGKKIICRAIDIEIWTGHHAHIKWDVVTDCIFIAPHIRDMAMADSRPQESDMKVHTIPCGVDLDRYRYRERQPGTNVAIVAERWVSKGVDYVLQLAMMSPDYTFHWLGKNNDYHWERDYFIDMISRNDLKIILYEDYVEDLDAWLDDKDYLLSASKKEAFGYNIAEAMAKGIKPIIHEFYGFGPIWGGCGHTWASLGRAQQLLTDPQYESPFYRQYLIDRGYTLDHMMGEFEKVIHN